jgi:hypothetical protein
MADNPAMESALTLSEGAEAIENLFGGETEEITEEATTEEETTEEAPTSETETDEEETEEVEEESEAPDEEGEEHHIETLADLAEALEMSPDDVLATLKTTVKVDGEESDVTLAELRDGYQKDADYRQKTAQLSERRTQLNTQVQEAVELLQNQKQAVEQQSLSVGHMLQQAQNLITGQMDSAQMNELRQVDPNEWTARRMEYQERLGTVQKLMQEAANQYATNQQALEQQKNQQFQQFVSQERAKLLEALPDWNDTADAALSTYLKDSLSFSDSEISSVADHRLIVLANKAMQFDALKSAEQVKTEATKKKVKKLPKLQKAAKTQGKVSVNQTQRQKLKSQLKKSGHVRDAAALLESMME